MLHPGRSSRSQHLTAVALVVVLAAGFAATSSHSAAAAADATGRSSGCGSPATPGTTTETVAFQGSQREYRLTVPENASVTHALPLILNFHADGSTALAEAVYSQMEAKAPARGFVVVTPQGSDPLAPTAWNIRPETKTPDDVAFSGALIDTISARLCIDEQRVYATGYSNGAGMTTYLGCKLSSRFGGIAPVGGISLVTGCPRGNPVSVIAFHGTADPSVPYTGGPDPDFPATKLPSVERAVATWARRDQCGATPTRQAIGTEVHRLVYPRCARGTGVTLYSVTNGGHTWPGSFDIPDHGHTTQDINATDLILNFFSQHPPTGHATKTKN
jgi:polyhydroxybutyrate depolymerase